MAGEQARGTIRVLNDPMFYTICNGKWRFRFIVNLFNVKAENAVLAIAKYEIFAHQLICNSSTIQAKTSISNDEIE